jgi:Fe-S cluster assembly protein SufD
MKSVEVNENIDSYVKGFNALIGNAVCDKIDWIRETKTRAINCFSDIGFPTLRHEDWRFTNLLPLVKTSYKLINGCGKDPNNIDISGLLVPEMKCSLLVFLDGRFEPQLSKVVSHENGIIVKNLSSAIKDNEELVRNYIFKNSRFEDSTFTALNTAYFEEGAFVYVPDHTKVDELIHILYVSTDNNEPYLQNPRNLFVIGDNSSAQIMEHYFSPGEGKYFSNTVTEANLGENSILDHYFIEAESNSAFNISSLDVFQKRSSNLNSHSLLLGGLIVRNNIHPVLAGEGCNTSINGLFMSRRNQHMDNFMKVEHASPHCDSRQLYNGILTDKSKGVFHGRIIVHKDAQKTDAKQTNRNLLLSDNAKIDTKPQLEIYADDVKCTHGATIGQMDKDAIFYLRSRGIEDDQAKSIILQAFAKQNIDNIKVLAIKKYIEKLVKDWFEQVGMGNAYN